MNYAGIIKDDIANGIGIRLSLFVSGCRNNCTGCFNKDQQDFNYGKEFTEDIENDIINTIASNEYYSGISILGGDPMEPENAEGLIPLINKFREKFNYNKSIWLYTGYYYKDLIKLDDNDPRKYLLKNIDILVDGPFDIKLKDISLRFRGSKNQKIIDIKKSISNKDLYYWKE